MGIFSFFDKSKPVKTVRVEFIDGGNNSVIGVSEVPLPQLPDTFAINTNLEIKGQKWSVTRAEPMEKSQFAKTGTLRLVLTRVQMVDPKDVFYSLPTISEDTGAVTGDALPSDRIFAIHEDDWRQVELVSTRFSAEIDQELVDIRRIWDEEKSGYGFKTLHVRQRIPDPLLDSALGLGDLDAIVSPKKRFDAIGFHRTRGTIPQSFAWATDAELVVWGVAEANGKVLRLCLSGLPRAGQIFGVSTILATLTDRFRLYFVDWCRTAKIRSETRLFEEYFASQNER